MLQFVKLGKFPGKLNITYEKWEKFLSLSQSYIVGKHTFAKVNKIQTEKVINEKIKQSNLIGKLWSFQCNFQAFLVLVMGDLQLIGLMFCIEVVVLAKFRRPNRFLCPF